MPIPLPNLDDRRWADLVEEGRALIPLYAPEWTDHNASDPGITLMEMFAWIAEMDIYEINRIPKRHTRKFLELVGIAEQPPREARAAVSVQPQSAIVELPQGVEFVGLDAAGVATPFRARHAVTAVPSKLAAVQSFDGLSYRDLTGRWQRSESLSVMGATPGAGAALYLGFDQALPLDVWVSLYFGTDSPIVLSSRHHSARLIWEVLIPGGIWVEATAQDGTRSLTQNGLARIKVPQAMSAAPHGSVSANLFWVRARLTAGEFDVPPSALFVMSNAVELDQAVPANAGWNYAAGLVPSGPVPLPGQSTGIRLSFDADKRISALTFDPAETVARFTVLETTPSLILEAVRVGTGTSGPNQTVNLPGAPVEQVSLHIFTLESDGWHGWHLRQDLDTSGPAGEHFLLDPTRGIATFGDGEHGRVPPDGSLIFARYRVTRAELGNVAVNKIYQLAYSAHNRAVLTSPSAAIDRIYNPAPATGGASAETLAHAIGRAIVLREAPLRAVTTKDFETLALATPGVRLARVGVWADVFPGFDCFPAAGVVTVILVPAMPVARPYPSPGLIRAVTDYLNPKRTIGTRVAVTGPSYLEVKVQARVRVYPGASKTQVRQAVLTALNAFLDALTGGPDGNGWPFGRDVYRSEVMQTINGTPDVDRVETLALFADGCGPYCGNICLRPEWLVTPGAHEIEVV